MKFFLLTFNLTILWGHCLFGQSPVVPNSNPSLPGYSGFHSNLGLQEIIEVGVPLAKPEESSFLDQVDAANANPRPRGPKQPKGTIIFSPAIGTRAYSTSNVLRQESTSESSGVLESNVGLGISRQVIKLNEYVTLIPRIDFMMQWAWYAENSELLDYRFGLVKGGLALGFPDNISAGVSLDYNTLHSLESGDKTFDSLSPSVSMQKVIPLTEDSFVMLDTMMRWSSMDAQTVFPAAGIFADSGDNYQNTLSISYLKLHGIEQEWTIMPRASINRTNYTKDANRGRTDYLYTAGLNVMYQVNDWFGIQSFGTYNSMDSDVSTVPEFEAFDIGISLNANYRF